MPNVGRELDAWRDAGLTAELWLRDDDACAPTPELDRLTGMLDAYAAPCLLAIVPLAAGPALAARMAGEALLRPAMHGVSHANHAPPGRKREETPDARGAPEIAEALAQARDRFVALFGARAGDWYVPPWNRIGRSAAGLLPGLGFKALSAFGSRSASPGAGVSELNAHVDLMDWKGGRIGRPLPAVDADLAGALAAARLDGGRPVGLLAHHLAHDGQAWEVLEGALDVVARHPAAVWRAADDLLRPACPREDVGT